ncbi:MAG TPA: ATP-binding cassette domain-containing protein [Acidimicrobiia bacterium]|nr:ATP-binding cassette domain-containing protein [Acidimicrobiia bacterium]
MSAISMRSVTYEYPDAPRAALADVELDVEPGELLLVVGSSGSGKSTLLRGANGLVPHSSGGRFAGDVVVFGRSTRTHQPRELADVVGFVAQDPEAQFVVDHVERDLAFVLENLGFAPDAMRRRVEETLDALGIAHLRDRDPASLSGGERQRCAIAGALAAAPSALVLDEPTSQLDPQGADDVLGALTRLNADLGTTVLLAEHRLERAAPLADRAVIMREGRVDVPGPPGAVLAGYPGAPSVTRLGRLLGWEPPPLTVRDARAWAARHPVDLPSPSDVHGSVPGELLLAARGVRAELGGRTVLRDVSVGLRRGDVVALLGRNGSGKTTLLRVLAGLLEPASGSVAAIAPSVRAAYVPQNPNSLLFEPTVRREVDATLHLLGRRDAGDVDQWLDMLGLTALADRHPRTLSGGERQRVAIAAVAVGGAPVLLLDEPTRGMDAASRHALEHAMHSHAASGGVVVLATHDVELAARSATRSVVLGDGEIVADGDARTVLAGSLFAPQVLRVLPPFLTVEEVGRELARSGDPR